MYFTTRLLCFRAYHGDYIGMESRPALLALLPRKEFPVYADVVKMFDAKFREMKADLLLTNNAIFLIGREKVSLRGEEYM